MSDSKSEDTFNKYLGGDPVEQGENMEEENSRNESPFDTIFQKESVEEK